MVIIRNDNLGSKIKILKFSGIHPIFKSFMSQKLWLKNYEIRSFDETIKVSVPKVSVPRVSVPNMSVPKINAPKVKKPACDSCGCTKLRKIFICNGCGGCSGCCNVKSCECQSPQSCPQHLQANQTESLSNRFVFIDFLLWLTTCEQS